MKPSAIGIVAEYNPFHNGHARQLALIREKTGPVPVIAVMSGSLTQRGELPLLDKWQRAALALLGGVDLVLELPVIYSLQSAREFARGGVEVLAATGIVSHLSFGCETEDFSLLQQLSAEKIAPEKWQQALSSGLSYAKAAETLAVKKNPAYKKIFQGSNNLLALEYVKALQKFPRVTPLPVQRQGSAYGETHLDAALPSASAIRRSLEENGVTETILQSLPPACRAPFQNFIKNKGSQHPQKALDLLLGFTLEKSTPQTIAAACQVSEGLEDLLYKHRRAGSFAALVARCATRRYSPSRIRRLLWQLLLSDASLSFKQAAENSPQYLRVLGFTPTGQKLLHRIKKEGALPLLTSVQKNTLQTASPLFRQQLQLDLRAQNLYELLHTGQITDADYKNKPVQAGDEI